MFNEKKVQVVTLVILNLNRVKWAESTRTDVNQGHCFVFSENVTALVCFSYYVHHLLSILHSYIVKSSFRD